MKKITAILLLTSLLLQSFAHYSVIALFELRRDYIAKNLCENRDRPELKCGGKCCLRKQLSKVDASNDASKSTNAKVDKWEVFVYILPQASCLCPEYIVPACRPFNPVSQHMVGYSPIHSVFRPPSAV